MSSSRKSQLESAAEKRQLVRLSRRFEDFDIRGYIVAVGPKVFLMSVVSDRVRFDGFEAFRIEDVRQIESDVHASFVKAVLRKRKERPPRVHGIKVDTLSSLLLTASRRFSIIAIHQEIRDPEVAHIGKVLKVAGGVMSMLTISPGAVWDDEPRTFRIAEITRVNFGGDYENALSIAADA